MLLRKISYEENKTGLSRLRAVISSLWSRVCLFFRNPTEKYNTAVKVMEDYAKGLESSKMDVTKIMNVTTNIDLLDCNRWDLNKISRDDIPTEKGIYAYIDKVGLTIKYVGSAVGADGLRKRIWGQHLNRNYLECREDKFTFKDQEQLDKGIIKNGKPAIEKSAFRKNIARRYNLSPGEDCLNFIKENFFIAIKPLSGTDKSKIHEIERELIQSISPEFNISKMLKGANMGRVLSKQIVIEFIRKKGKNYEWETKTGKPFVVSIEGESVYCQPIGKAGVKINFFRLNKFINAWNELGANALTSEYRDFVGGGFGVSYIPIILDECFTNNK